MHGGADFHLRRRNVDIRKLLELVVHARQTPPDVVRRAPPSDIQVDAAMRTAPARLDLSVDRPRDLITRQQVRRAAVVNLIVIPAVRLLLSLRRLRAKELRNIAKHEALAFSVTQGAAVTPNALCDENPANAGWPDHAGRVELDELH